MDRHSTLSFQALFLFFLYCSYPSIKHIKETNRKAHYKNVTTVVPVKNLFWAVEYHSLIPSRELENLTPDRRGHEDGGDDDSTWKKCAVEDLPQGDEP